MDRGYVGRQHRTPTRQMESYQDFCRSLRNFVRGPLTQTANLEAQRTLDRAIEANGNEPVTAQDRRFIFDSIPAIAVRNRLNRTGQDMTWGRLFEEYHHFEQEHSDQLAETDTTGPGSVSCDPDLVPPDYMQYEIHNQPGGYHGDPFAGFSYIQATNSFFLGLNDQDEVHREIADRIQRPKDDKIDRILDIACSAGQTTIALKERFPKADVWGIDYSAAQIRYAHKRAVDLNVDVHFAQQLVSQTTFPDSHFDVVNSFILFHEVPVDAAKHIVEEIYRILRPGGTFTVTDFGTGKTDLPPFEKYSLEVNGRDNGEPYALDFVISDFKGLLRDVGFDVAVDASFIMGMEGVFGTKPDPSSNE